MTRPPADLSAPLHIINGDAAGDTLGASPVAGTVLPWRDVLHEGPVPGGLDIGALSEVRATFLAGLGGPPLEQLRRDFAARDAALAGAHRHPEVVLWFEHDLYDQLQLIQLLAWFRGAARVPARLSLICIDRFDGVEPFRGLGQLNAAQLAGLYPTRQAVTPEQLALGARAWEAFTAPDLGALASLMGDPLDALPFLADALGRWLEEAPDAAGGLSRTERQVLELVAEGTHAPGRLFAANQGREAAPFMGDWSFWQVLAGLCGGAVPLLACAPSPFVHPPKAPLDDAFRAQHLTLTEAGADVLAGLRNHIAVNGIHRWMGGIFLEG